MFFLIKNKPLNMINFLNLKLILIIILCFVLGCSTKDKFKTEGTFCFKMPDFKNMKMVSYMQAFDKNKDLQIYYNTIEKKIIFKDILTDSIILSVPMMVLDTLIKKSESTPFFPCYIQNFDTIYYVDVIKFNTYRLNSKGEITRKWVIEKQNPQGCKLSPEGWVNGVLINSNNIYISCYKEGFDYKNKATLKTIFDAPTYLIGDLNCDTIKFNKSCGNFPAFYQNEYYYGDPPSTCIDNKGRIVFSFAKDDNLYVYQEDSLIKVVEAKSKFAEKFEPFDINQFMDIGYVMRYYEIQSGYSNIYYDTYRKKYYRIYEHTMAEFDSENKKNLPEDKVWSIIILDENLNKIKEIKIDPKEYPGRGILSISKGLLLMNKTQKDSKKSCYTLIDIEYD